MTGPQQPDNDVSDTQIQRPGNDVEDPGDSISQDAEHDPESSQEMPPPLPPRPKQSLIQKATGAFLKPKAPTLGSRSPSAAIPARATTAVSLTEAKTTIPGSDDNISSPGITGSSEADPPSAGTEDAMSTRSYTATAGPMIDAESMLGDVLDKDTLAWKNWATASSGPHIDVLPIDTEFEDVFEREFDELDDMTSDGLNEEAVVKQWKSKLKQFFILSRAGKPVWSRHGTDQLVTSYIGVILTLISFYEGASDGLKGFTANGTRFVVLTKGQLYLVAISSLGESDQQLRAQLEALYMQILSTLTLPVMERMFKSRASTDLRRTLQGTDKLLSALADGFTRGSPSTLLSALECLRMRKSHRQLINNALLKTRSERLLYGLIVAGGRLVSVVRPRKHSLHPGDLHLIFNMLFEAGGVKAGEGENWIPLCLPGFNNTGYVYMYVSFLPLDSASEQIKKRISPLENLEEVAVILISADKEAFFELQQMKDDLLDQMNKNSSFGILNNAVKRGRMSCADVIPGSVLSHFIYKSKNNVQFVVPSFEPHFSSLTARRQLVSVYAHLHASIHSRPAPPKIHYTSTTKYSALGWATQNFELYALAVANTSRLNLSQIANRIIQHIRREEERVFIIGGAVF